MTDTTTPASGGLVPADGREPDAETIDVRPDPLGPPVDQPDERRPLYATITARRDEQRAPIVPAWVRNADQRKDAATWALDYARHAAAFHAVRLPKYAAKTAAWSVVGAGRLAGRQLRWWWLAEQHYLRQQAANNNDPDTWMRLHAEARKVRSWRGFVLLAEGLGVGVALALLVLMGPAWLAALVIVATAPPLAILGRPSHKPITDRVSTGPRFIKLTADMTRAGLVATGKVKAPEDVHFTSDIHRDGPGWLAEVALPSGVIATDVMDKREQLAGGLRLPLDQVWPETVKGEHPGRLNIFVADRPVSAAKPPSWPMLEDGQVDYFQPYVVSYDVRLRPATWALRARNSLFGGMPGSGKTLSARNVALGAVLDPLVVPVISELKGSGDWEMFEPLCPKGGYVCGADHRSISGTVDLLEWLYGQCETRPPLIARYARQGLNDTKQLNRAMAERDERLRPIVAVFDEIQEAVTDPEHGKRVIALLTSIVKRGRALGIHLILATQRLDKESLPKGVTSNVSNRSCLSVPSHIETDLVLGTSAFRQGARPTAFTPGEDAGWQVVAGLAAGFQTVRSFYLDDKAAEAICQRALAIRRGVTMSDEPVRGTARNLLADVRLVWPSGETAVWSEVIVGMLRELDPDAYGDLTTEVFGAQMAAAGCPTRDIGKRVDGKQATKKGVRIEALDAAIKAKQIDD